MTGVKEFSNVSRIKMSRNRAYDICQEALKRHGYSVVPRYENQLLFSKPSLDGDSAGTFTLFFKRRGPGLTEYMIMKLDKSSDGESLTCVMSESDVERTIIEESLKDCAGDGYVNTHGSYSFAH